MDNRTGLCLSIQQPWAWLIVNGYKSIENRDWATRVRGVIGIHAGQKFDSDGFEWVTRTFPEINLPAIVEFERGGIVGTATLVDCVTEVESPWFFGKFGFILADAKAMPLIPCHGRLGFFRPDISSTLPEGR